MKVSASKFFPYIRNLLSDERGERFTDDCLLMYFQDALFQLSLVKPYAFSSYIDLVIEDENVLQRLPETVSEIIDIHAINGLSALKETGKTRMDEMTPDWINEPAGDPKQWMRDKRSNNVFFLYPTPKKGTSLTIQCVYIPILKDNDTMFDFNIQYQPVLVSKVVAIALSTSSEDESNKLGVLFDQMVDKILKVDEINEKLKLEDKN